MIGTLGWAYEATRGDDPTRSGTPEHRNSRARTHLWCASRRVGTAEGGQPQGQRGGDHSGAEPTPDAAAIQESPEQADQGRGDDQDGVGAELGEQAEGGCGAGPDGIVDL